MRENCLPRWLRCGAVCWIIAFFILALLNWHGRNLGYWWDSAGYVQPHTREIYSAGLFPILKNYDVGHPTLFYFLAALMMKFFGPGVFGVHLLTWGFGAMCVVALYALARTIGLPRSISGGVAIAYITYPLVWAQLGQLQLDLPFVALGLAAIALWCREKPMAYFVFASGALLTKIYGFTLVFGILATMLLTNNNLLHATRDKRFRREILWAISPLISLGVFLLVRFLVRGPSMTVGFPQTREIEPFWAIETMWRRFGFLWSDAYIMTYANVAVCVASLTVIVSLLRAFCLWRKTGRVELPGQQHARVFLAIILWTLALHIVIVMVKEHSCARYISAVPAICDLAAVYALWRILPRNGVVLPLIGIVVAMQVVLWHPSHARYLPAPLDGWLVARAPGGGWNYELDLQYTDAIRLTRWAVKRAEKNAILRGSTAAISTQWPIDGVLADPASGYVDAPMDVASTTSWDQVDAATHPYVIELPPIQSLAGAPPENAKVIARRQLTNVEVIVWRLKPRP